MKTSRTLPLVGVALIIGFLAARWCTAQSAQQASRKEPPTHDFGALHQWESFVLYLQETKQTNTLQRSLAFLAMAALDFCLVCSTPILFDAEQLSQAAAEHYKPGLNSNTLPSGETVTMA